MSELVALVDVCDTVVDLRGGTLKNASIVLPKQMPSTWDLFEIIDDAACERVIELWDDPSFWEALRPVQGSQEGIEELRTMGFHIQWVTSPWHSCENWDNIRRHWLQKHFSTSFHDITFTTRKYMIEGDVFIDDRPKHIKLWSARHHGKPSILFDSVFNQHFEWQPRGDWKDVVKFIRQDALQDRLSP